MNTPKSPYDYIDSLLVVITKLTSEISERNAVIDTLKADIVRLNGHSNAVTDTMHTSVPLRRHDSGDDHRLHSKRGLRNERNERDWRLNASAGHTRSKMATPSGTARPSMTLSDVVKANETVTIEVIIRVPTGSNNATLANATTTFDGTDLVVKECELIPSLVGMKSSKPGEILYKFIDGLVSAGHLKQKFTVAPWKLCYVERDGIKVSLESLR